MSDQATILPVDPNGLPPASSGGDSMVDQVVAQAGNIQDLFANHDQTAESAGSAGQDVQAAVNVNRSGLGSVADPVEDVSPGGLTSQASDTLSSPISSSDGEDEHAGAQRSVVSPVLAGADEDVTQPADSASAMGEEAGKSPLDILEEILGKQKEGGAAADGPPKEPELTPEQLAAIEAQKAAEAAAVEAHRLKLIEEARSGEQQQRDQIREEQAESLKVVSEHDVKQLERKKVYVGQ